MTQTFRKLSLLIGDIFLLFVALYGALLVRNNFIVTPETWALNWPDFSVVFLLWLIIFYIADFYNIRYAKNNQSFVLRLSIVIFIMIAVALSYFYLLPHVEIAPKRILVFQLTFAVLLIIAWRSFFNSLIKLPTTNCTIIGYTDATKSILKELEKNPQWGFKVKAIFDEFAQPAVAPIPVMSDLTKIPKTIKSTRTSLVVVDDALLQSDNITEQLFELLNKNVRVTTLSRFYENTARKIPLHTIGKSWFIDNISEQNNFFYDKFKRFMDIVLSLFGLVITLPLYPLFFIAIKLNSPGPLFIRQTRVGYHGEHFTIIKFRSMIDNAEKHGEQWNTKNDPRVTHVGKIMRATRLDELPQLMNILLGNMSFVGPRAERPGFTEELAKQLPFFKQRLLAKPGLSGWAQVNYKYGASVEDAIEKLQYDLYYIKHRNWYLDVSIILKTIRIVITGVGY